MGWQNWEYWTKGALIGGLIYFILSNMPINLGVLSPFLYIQTLHVSIINLLTGIFSETTPVFSILIISSYVCRVIDLIIWAIVGVVVGLIIDRNKDKKKRRRK